VRTARPRGSDVVTKDRLEAFPPAENYSRPPDERRDGRSPGSPIVISGRLPRAIAPVAVWPSTPGSQLRVQRRIHIGFPLSFPCRKHHLNVVMLQASRPVNTAAITGRAAKWSEVDATLGFEPRFEGVLHLDHLADKIGIVAKFGFGIAPRQDDAGLAVARFQSLENSVG